MTYWSQKCFTFAHLEELFFWNVGVLVQIHDSEPGNTQLHPSCFDSVLALNILNSGKHNSQVIFVSRQGLYQDLSQFTRNRERKIPSFQNHPGHPGPSCASFIRSMGLGLLVRFFFFSFGIFGTRQCNTSFHFISAAGIKETILLSDWQTLSRNARGSAPWPASFLQPLEALWLSKRRDTLQTNTGKISDCTEITVSVLTKRHIFPTWSFFVTQNLEIFAVNFAMFLQGPWPLKMLEQRGGCPFSLSVGLENVEHGWTQIRNANSSLFFHCKCRSHQIAFFCQRAIFFHASQNGFVQSVISGSYSIREIAVHVQFWFPPCVFWLCLSTTTSSKCFHTKYNPRITVRLCSPRHTNDTTNGPLMKFEHQNFINLELNLEFFVFSWIHLHGPSRSQVQRSGSKWQHKRDVFVSSKGRNRKATHETTFAAIRKQYFLKYTAGQSLRKLKKNKIGDLTHRR